MANGGITWGEKCGNESSANANIFLFIHAKVALSSILRPFTQIQASATQIGNLWAAEKKFSRSSATSIPSQGAAMAIKEARVLRSLFPLGTTREEVPARLAAYETLKRERQEFVNTESVSQATVPSRHGYYLRSWKMQATIIEYNVIHITQEYYAAHFSTSTTV
ncbi:hypothetical protein C8R44DRAFT_742306 [Mycena epipterygia]|nr:hypothetical protein C8R44DRAFT_742306 [Mycena epipterygia]